MLHILLMLLKIIGMILLIILGILILSVCVVLFVPLRYQGTASASGTVDSIKAKVKFSWLLHLVSGYVTYENKETDWQVRILWKKLNIIEEPTPKESTSEQSTSEEPTSEESTSEEPTSEEPSSERPTSEQSISEEPTSEQSSSEQRKTEKTKFFEKIKYTFQNICDKIKLLIKKKEELQAFLTNEVHRFAWKRIKHELGRLLRFLKPKKLTANLHFGFEDPATTGKVLAGLSILYPFYGDHINITPEFEEKILEGDVFIKGHVMGIHLLIVIWNLYFDKNIKTTYKDIQKWRK